MQVLTAGTRYDQDAATREGKPIPTGVVTLVLTPDDAEKLTLASMEGSITLTLRNPLDVAPTVTDGAKLNELLGDSSLPPVKQVVQGRAVVRAAPKPAAPPTPPKYIVETIRAAKRTDEEVR